MRVRIIQDNHSQGVMHGDVYEVLEVCRNQYVLEVGFKTVVIMKSLCEVIGDEGEYEDLH